MATKKTRQQLKIEKLQARLQELEETLEAIRSGGVDAIVSSGPEGNQVYTIEGADHAYRVMVESMSEGAVTIATDGSILYANSSFAKITGASPTEIIGRRFHDFVWAEDYPLFDVILDSQRNGCSSAELRLRRNGPGSEIPVEISSNSVVLSNAKRALTLIITDLSAQKRYEEIVAAEKLSRLILDQALEGIAVCIDGCIVRANQVLYQICGSIPLMQPFDQIFSFQLPDSQSFSVAIPESGKTIWNQEVRYVRPDGTSFDLILNAGPLVGTDGEVFGCIVSILDITSRKLAEEALRESEERYRGVVQNTTAIILRIDAQGIIRFANERAQQFFGYSAEELIGKHAVGTIVPERDSTGRDLATMVDAIAENPDRYYSNANENVRKNGERVWMEWTNSGIYDTDGKLKEFLSVGIDATERKRAEEALLESEERFRNMAELSPALIVLARMDGTLLFTNPAFDTAFGFHTGELIGRKSSDLYANPKDRQRLIRMIQISGSISGHEVQAKKKDGTFFWISASTRVIRFGGEQVLLSAFLDITERKRTEEALRLSKERFSKAFNHSPNAITITRLRDGKIIEGNESAYEMLGYGHEEVVGKTTYDLNIWADSADRDRLVRELLSGGSVRNRELVLLAKGGRPVAVDVSASLITIEGDQCFLTSFIDITDRKQAEESVERLKALMDHNPSLAFLKDESGRYVYLNNAYEKQFALTKDWHGKTDFDFWPKESAELFRANDREILQSGQVKQFLEDSLDPNGTRYCWLAYKFSFADSNHKRYVGGIGINVTDRVQAEEALRRAKDELEERVRERTAELHFASLYTRSLIEASLDPLVTISPEGKITDVNHATEEATGLRRSQLIGSDFSDYFTDPGSARAGYRKVLADGHVQDYPLTIINASGGTTDVLYNATVYRNEEGGIQGVFAAARDVTARKRAEEAVKEERQRFYDVLEALPAMICLLTPDYHVTFANKGFRDRFGEAHGRHCYEYCFGKAEPCEFCESYTVLKTGKPHQWEVKSPDGSVIAAYDFPFTDTDGSPLILEMDIDITAQRKAEEELVLQRDRLKDLVNERTAQLAANVLLQKEVAERTEAEKELRISEELLLLANEHLEQRVRERTMELHNLMEQLERSRSDLRHLASELVLSEERERKRVATVMHDEICQTLAVAKMRVDMLQGSLVDDGSRKILGEAREFLVQSIREARALMNDVGNPLLFDMGVSAACNALAERLMAIHPIQIRCDIQDSLKDLDPDMKVVLYQLIQELLNNVVKHSGADSAWVSIRTDNGWINAEVGDDGKGFDRQMLGAPTAEGGFGLFSIQERLKAFNADLQIETAPGKGTVVKATLPTGLGGSKGTGPKRRSGPSS